MSLFGAIGPASGAQVLIAGDSMCFGTLYYSALGDRLEKAKIEPVYQLGIGWTSDAVLDAAEPLFVRSFDLVVFDAGTNDRTVAALRRSVRRVTRWADGMRVVMATVGGTHHRAKNRMLRRFERREAIELLRWRRHAAGRGVLTEDRIHPTRAGYAFRARLFYRRITEEL